MKYIMVVCLLIALCTGLALAQGDWRCRSECNMIAEAYEGGCVAGGGDPNVCNYLGWDVIWGPCMVGCGYPNYYIADGPVDPRVANIVKKARTYWKRIHDENPSLTKEEALALMQHKVWKWAKRDAIKQLNK